MIRAALAGALLVLITASPRASGSSVERRSVRTKPQTAESSLIKDLRGGNAVARINAASDLSKVNWSSPRVVDALIAALKDGDWNVRFNALYALSRQKPAAIKAVPAMRGALKDENPRVRANARRFIEEIEGWSLSGGEPSELGRDAPPNPERLFARKRKEQEAKGNLGMIRAALQLYNEDKQGRFPAALRELVPKYLPEIPILDIDGHKPGRTVRTLETLDDAGDSGQWLYVRAAGSPLTGAVYFDCAHEDSSGHQWREY